MYKAKVNDTLYDVEIKDGEVLLNGNTFNWDVSKISDHSYHIIKDNRSFRIEVVQIDYKLKSITLKINGNRHDVKLKDKFDLLLEKLGMDAIDTTTINDIKAPMPGLIFEINVTAGDEVKKGDPIMILEAMKMENVIKANGDGTVKSVKVKKGESVEKNQVLVQF